MGLAAVSVGCPGLQSLGLSGCKQVADAGLAVLRVDAKGLEVAAPGTALGLASGAPVFVVGSAAGLDFHVQVGRVHDALVWHGFRPYFTTDLTLGPRHQGTPVFDADGRVLGVVSDLAVGGRRLALYVEQALRGDAVLVGALGRQPLGTDYGALLANAEAGGTQGGEKAHDPQRPQPHLEAVSRTLRFSRNAWRGCPKRDRLCRSRLEVELVQVVPGGGTALPPGDAYLKFARRGGGDTQTQEAHVVGHVPEWKPIPPGLARGGLRLRAPNLPRSGLYLGGTARFSGRDAYRILDRHPELRRRFLVQLGASGSNELEL